MPKKITTILIGALVLIMAGGCTKRQCVEADYSTFKPILDYPADGATVKFAQPISLDWHHEEPCEPHGYMINMYDPVKNQNGFDLILDGSSEKVVNMGTFIPFIDVHQGKEYQWSVVPVGESWGTVQGQESEKFTLTYGKECTPGELVPPVLLSPEDGSWVSLKYSPPGIDLNWAHLDECYPDGYHYQIATDPNFEHIVKTEKFDNLRTQVTLYLPQCTHLYWRVQSWVGNSKSAFSDTQDFYYAYDNTCWQVQTPGDEALIKGYIFEDKCDHTNPIVPLGEEVLPPCVSSEYGVHADGVWDSNANDEPKVWKALVKLGSGPCPSTGLDEFKTWGGGMYYFTPPNTPAEYCVSISKADNPQFDDGIWTLPLTDQDITQQTISIGPSNEEINLNFGWDKNDFEHLNFKVDTLSTCRQTDNKNSAAVMYLEEGAVIPVVATNETKTWFLTRFNCFVSVATGEAEEGDLPLYPEQPIPVMDGEGDPGQTDGGGTDGGEKPCSSYTSGPRGCPSPRCVWVYPMAGPAFCTESD